MSIISGEFVREKQFSCNLLRLNAFYMQIVVRRLDVAECGRMRQRDAALFVTRERVLFMIFNELVFHD